MERVVLEIIDDGLGFDPNAVESGGLGLTSMQERADEIGAQLAVSPIPGSGTRIRIVVEEQFQ
jgi:signal transduction histidine kinase